MRTPSANQLIGQLRFRQLQMLCALAEKGSMRSAAESMNLTAAALSKSLRELETLLGRTLFTRTSQGIVPTPQGESFVRSARAMVGEMRALLTSEASGRVSAPPLRLGAISYAIWALMPRVLQELRTQGERVQLIGLPGGTTPLAEQLSAGELDAVLTLYTADSLQAFDQELVAIDTLAPDPLLVVAGHGVLDARATHEWSDLRERPWILPPRRTHVRQAVDAAFLHAGLIPPEPMVDAAQLYGCLRLAAEGLGVTAMPRSAVVASGLHDKLDVIPVTPPLPSLTMVVAYRRSAIGRRGLHALIDSLRQLQPEDA